VEDGSKKVRCTENNKYTKDKTGNIDILKIMLIKPNKMPVCLGEE
jgi:hypothetical protein